MQTIKNTNVPDDVFEALAHQAEQDGTSIERVAANILSKATGGVSSAERRLVAQIRKERKALAAKGMHLTDAWLRKAKDWGRK